ncbi:oxidoreductase [Actinomycetes bacterium]|nr:oxidoreductase [Actinomycetes bacterium]
MMLRWGFIGAGNIATRALAPAVHNSLTSSLYAVASRDTNRSQALSPTKVHASYGDLIADPDVDAVYISLANHQHAEWAIKALQAGKHVLCEKPLASTHAEAKLMADAARISGKLLVEAVWTRWHPRFIRAVELTNSGDLGHIVQVDSCFTFNTDMSENYRGDPAMGGGALLDVGLYEIHLWRALSDATFDIKITSVKQNMSPAGVDLTTEIVATSSQGAKLNALSSFEMPSKQQISVLGTASSINFAHSQAFSSWREKSTLAIGDHTEEFEAVDAYQLMVDGFAAQTLGRDGWILPIQESLDVMRLLDEVKKFAQS